VSLKVLTLDAATSQARDTLPNLNCGENSHALITSEKYIVAGVKAQQGQGSSHSPIGNTIIGEMDEAKRTVNDVLLDQGPQANNQPKTKRLKKKHTLADEDPVLHWVDGHHLKIWPKLALLRVAR
jgi:hypothetical protein